MLKSGNALVTSRYNDVYKQDAPDWHLTPAEKIAQGNDTNRGFVRIIPNSNAGGALHMWGTLQIFVMPEIARGKDCRCEIKSYIYSLRFDFPQIIRKY